VICDRQSAPGTPSVRQQKMALLVRPAIPRG